MKQIFNTRQVSKKVFFSFLEPLLIASIRAVSFLHKGVPSCPSLRAQKTQHSSCVVSSPYTALTRHVEPLHRDDCTSPTHHTAQKRKFARSTAKSMHHYCRKFSLRFRIVVASSKTVWSANSCSVATKKKKRTRRTKAHTKRQRRFVCSNTDASACFRVQRTPCCWCNLLEKSAQSGARCKKHAAPTKKKKREKTQSLRHRRKTPHNARQQMLLFCLFCFFFLTDIMPL